MFYGVLCGVFFMCFGVEILGVCFWNLIVCVLVLVVILISCFVVLIELLWLRLIFLMM